MDLRGVAVLHQQVPGEEQNAAAVLKLLRYNRASGSVVEAWVTLERFSPFQSVSVLRPDAGGVEGRLWV